MCCRYTTFKSLCWYTFTVRMSRMLSRWRALSVWLWNVSITVGQKSIMVVLKWAINNWKEDTHVKCILIVLFFVHQCLVGSVAVTWDWVWQSILRLVTIILLREMVSWHNSCIPSAWISHVKYHLSFVIFWTYQYLAS